MSEKKDIYFRRCFPLTAQKLTVNDYISVARWCQGKPISDFGKFGLSVRGDGGPIKVWIGDWIIKNPANGKYFVVDDQRFNRYFEDRDSKTKSIGRFVKSKKTIDQTWNDNHVYVQLEGFDGEPGVTTRDYLTREALNIFRNLMTRVCIMTQTEVDEEIVNYSAFVKMLGIHTLVCLGGPLKVKVYAEDLKDAQRFILGADTSEYKETEAYEIITRSLDSLIDKFTHNNQSAHIEKED